MELSYKSPDGFTEPHILSGMPADTPILVGFSGGADSTALLHMLVSYGQRTGAKIYAAHVNHGIRGEEADRDEDFCKKLCEALSVEFCVLHADVPSVAAETGDSIETAARKVRYSYFDKLMSEKDIPLLATAHNANDNLETILFNICRGASLSGMCGIPETRSCNGGTVIRPILGMTKARIVEYCSLHDLAFVTDSTNTDTDYTRNKIRVEIVPKLCEINSNAVENASRLSKMLRDDSLCLESMKDMFTEGLCEGASVEPEKLLGSPAAIANRAIVSMYKDVAPDGTLEYTHIDAIRKLCAKAVPHSYIDLPCGVEAAIEDGRLSFRKKQKKGTFLPYTVELCEEKNIISQTNCEIIMGYSQNPKNIYKNSILTSIDSATICGQLFVRGRAAGDRIRLNGMSKSVKKLMCDKKIPLELRDRLPVICDDNGIVAIPLLGVRDGSRPKASGETLHLLLRIL